MSDKLRHHIGELIDLTDEEYDRVLPFFHHRSFRKNQYAVQAGDYVNNDYFVLSGLFKSFYTDPQGKEHVVLFATENWWVSDPEAYHTRSRATLNVSCLEDSETLGIMLPDRDRLCAEIPKMESFFLRKTTAGYLAAQRRILSLISNNARQRYEFLLQQYPGLLQRVPKSLIASYLGITRETLSRLTARPT